MASHSLLPSNSTMAPKSIASDQTCRPSQFLLLPQYPFQPHKPSPSPPSNSSGYRRTSKSPPLSLPLPPICYHLSKWPNCSHGTCSGLVIWQLRYTADTLSRTRHITLFSPPCLVSAPVTQNGGVNRIMPVLSMTPASVLALVPFP